tara:strand:+ start:3946 stop:5028 length:1083 start_codon:yes stop_codon:yes gene_type:complete
MTPVGYKIKKLMKDGYSHKQAVAIALKMYEKGFIGPRGGKVSFGMKSFKEKDLLLDFNINKYVDYYEIDNNKVYIVIKPVENNKLDLDRFYSKVAIPGYARCSLYYMLKQIIENEVKFNRDTEIGISIIAPSKPRRNIDTIKKTYKNIGFDKIECIQSKGLTKKEYEDLVKKYPEMKGSYNHLSQDSELCSANFEKVGKILEKLKFCDETYNYNSNVKRGRDTEFLINDEDIEAAKKYKGPILTDEDLLNYFGKKQFLFNPKNPKKSFDVYIDKNPKDTIPIKYKTYSDTLKTIRKLERLYKSGKYTHKRIKQVAMILMVRLRVLKKKKMKSYTLAKRYHDFLAKRTKTKKNLRKKLIFK